jgi:F-type H+-transporting ATPase subunit b
MTRAKNSFSKLLKFAALLTFLLVLLPGCGRMAAQANPQSVSAAKAANANQTVLNETDAYRLSPVVVKFGALLGMSPEVAANVFTIFNILILVGGVGYGLMKTLPNAFRKRNTQIQKHLVDARTATEEATARLNSVEQRLSKLDEQIAAMRSQAEVENKRNEERMKSLLEEEQQKILEATEAEIYSATAAARRDIQRYAANLAVENAASRLNITGDTDHLLIQKFAQQLGEGSNN